MMKKKGAAMVLALVLCLSLLPTAVALVSIARSDLESALEDYHSARAWRAAWGGLELARANLLAGGSGQIRWPDSEVVLVVTVDRQPDGWLVASAAQSGGATATAKIWVPATD